MHSLWPKRDLNTGTKNDVHIENKIYIGSSQCSISFQSMIFFLLHRFFVVVDTMFVSLPKSHWIILPLMVKLIPQWIATTASESELISYCRISYLLLCQNVPQRSRSIWKVPMNPIVVFCFSLGWFRACLQSVQCALNCLELFYLQFAEVHCTNVIKIHRRERV